MLLFHLQGIGLVVADARGVDHVCHPALLNLRFFKSGPRRRLELRATPAKSPIFRRLYAIAAVRAIAATGVPAARFPLSG
jgi:hypothetical protein